MQKTWFFSAVIFMCCATGAVAADSFTLTGVTPGGANMGGVFTSPYVATISGVGSGINVICDDYADEVYLNETWNVVATNLSSLSTTGSGDGTLRWDPGNSAATQVSDYVTVAILGAELLSINSNTQQAEDLSFAIWDVFYPTASAGLGDASNIASDLSAAQNMASADLKAAGNNIAAALSLDNISNVTIYTANPDSGGAVTSCTSGSTCGAPQEFVTVSMAEPSLPALLGVDFLGVGGLILFVRRRRVNSSNLTRS
jgi:hypothetical protein